MFIIYGEEPPKISLTQSPRGESNITFLNERIVKIDPVPKTLRWSDVYGITWSFCIGEMMKGQPETIRTAFIAFTNELEKLTGSPAENRFFSEYVKVCLEGKWSNVSWREDPWQTPALIPQAWVNWIHYDWKDKQRAERAQREPFRVDFMMKSEAISPDFVIIEIDGLSHIRDYDPIGNPIPSTSMDSFTRHIQKDRWLRKQGWQVFRITSQEVDQCTEFEVLLWDVLGDVGLDIF
jgi:very-short-patch-repair endonuclease